MEQEPKLIHSLLCQTIERDGTHIEVLIYRLEDDVLWQLEVVDAENGSTVWDDKFLNDKDALDEVLRVIKEEGIHTFLGVKDTTIH